MFDPSDKPRVFALAPGVDFPKGLVEGLRARTQDLPPEALARVEIFTNTRRMARRVASLFDDGPATLLPSIRLLTDLSNDPERTDVPLPVSSLRRQLELARLVERLVDEQPDLAPRGAIYDLAESLAALFDEIEGEGVSAEAIFKLDVTDSSGHWARSLQFIEIVRDYIAGEAEIGAEARQRRVVEGLIARWQTAPPQHPIIVAGSTGSRGTTALLMQAVARLPQGALVLPGFDFEMPPAAWGDLKDPMTSEDHPQYRFAALLRGLSLTPGDVNPWSDTQTPSPARNRLVSLALRPAPVTDSWLAEGPGLGPLADATGNMTLVHATSPRHEANAIALRLRKAAEDGEVAALITPDRVLSRQVAACLDRWGITPDDSGGRPLSLSAPGRFLRHVAVLMMGRVTAEDLLTVLKHPLCHSGSARGMHLLWTRELELSLRRNGPPFPMAEDLITWAEKRDEDDGRLAWARWIGSALGDKDTDHRPLEQLVAAHIDLAQSLSDGPESTEAGELWKEGPGRAASAAMGELREQAPYGGSIRIRDYFTLMSKFLAGKEVRNPDEVHPDIMIWGTLEARVQGADLVILGGLNDGIWPAAPSPDPWLNRELRKKAGLLLPERRIGLSAHDFQQALGAREVWLTRAVRDEEAETVPSRWLNRLVNLTSGLRDQGGTDALDAMLARGQTWLDWAETLDQPAEGHVTESAHRPSPNPPVAARPRQLSVTQIKTLIRDPYAIYAQKILGLRKLDPIRQSPDAPLRGTILHKVLEEFVAGPNQDNTRDALIAIAEQVLEDHAPWPAARRLWLAKIARVADWFLEGEAERASRADPIAFETKGGATIPELGFTLTAKADRMDRQPDGQIRLYDYKTGKPPSAAEQKSFDKQLLLEAAMIANGAFDDIGPAEVAEAAYIGVGSAPSIVPAPLEEETPEKVWDELARLIRAYLSKGKGFTARRAVAKQKFEGDFDQLARFGEWDTSMPAVKETLE